MKISTKIILILCMVLLICGFAGFDAFYIAPSRFQIRYETLTSTSIPEQLNDVNLLYFSDLDYGEFMDATRAEKLVNKINDAGADVVVFGGDLFAETYTITEEDITTITTLLSSIHAPLGKFAVYGESDELNEERFNTVNTIYSTSDFEVLNNKAITLHNLGSQSITLVGLDNSIRGNIDIDGTFASVSRDTYVLAVLHAPDDAIGLPDFVNYCIAGHSLGGQVFYGIGSMREVQGAINYYRGINETSNGVKLDITNGVGTLDTDVRLFTNPEIVLYRFVSKVEQTASPTLETTSSEEPTNPATEIPAETEETPADTEIPVETEAPVEEQPVEEDTSYEEEQPVEEQQVQDNTEDNGE